jgi:hypothetical protein
MLALLIKPIMVRLFLLRQQHKAIKQLIAKSLVALTVFPLVALQSSHLQPELIQLLALSI